MKIEYICDVCGKHYNSKKEVEACEADHKAKDDVARKEFDKKICQIFDDYIKRFKKMPQITMSSLSKESQEILKNHVGNLIDDLFDEVFDDLIRDLG